MFHNVLYCVRHAQNVLLSVNVERSENGQYRSNEGK